MSSDPDDPLLFRTRTGSLSRHRLRLFAGRLKQQVAHGRSFGCLIAPDKELRRLNREFRNKNVPTDVLSFPAPSRNGMLGEIAISFDRAREQALEHGHSAEDELKILMLHGLLHLIGLDHETDDGRMARTERRWRQRLGLPSGLIERAGAGVRS